MRKEIRKLLKKVLENQKLILDHLINENRHHEKDEFEARVPLDLSQYALNLPRLKEYNDKINLNLFSD
jgi:hypothetical protein